MHRVPRDRQRDGLYVLDYNRLFGARQRVFVDILRGA